MKAQPINSPCNMLTISMKTFKTSIIIDQIIGADQRKFFTLYNESTHICLLKMVSNQEQGFPQQV